MADLLGSDFSLAGERIWRRFPYHFLFRGVGHEVRILSSAITIEIDLLDLDVDRSMAEFEECRLEWGLDFNRDTRRWG